LGEKSGDPVVRYGHLPCPLALKLASPITATRAKKNPNERFGFNPPKEEVEETAEVAELLQPMGSII
jgi:hypothetical protein